MIEMLNKVNVIEKNKVFINSFRSFFSNEGYIEENAKEITSRFDKSVYFIGSAISVLKPYFLENKIPSKGVFLIQPAIRTRNLSNIYEESELPEWSSYFKALGILVKYENLEDICRDIWNFFNKEVGIKKENFLVRGFSEDKDLLKYWIREKDNIPNIEINSMPINYYRHKYGLSSQGIFGRNINLALRSSTRADFKDIGNIIVIESADKKYGVEAAFGVSNTISKIMGYKSSLEVDLFANLQTYHDIADYKFADCITTITHLMHENLKMNASNSEGRLLRKYLQALLFWSGKLGVSVDKICELVKEYERLEYEYCKIRDDQLKGYLKKLIK